MQNDFIDGALGSPEAQAIVDNVVKKIKNWDGEILVTYDTHLNNYMETREGKYLPVPHCIMDTEGWQLNEKVQAALDTKNTPYKRVLKPTFGSTSLVERLKGCDQFETEVTLCGLCTDICLVSNAMLLKANYPEMNISVVENCCAGVTPESHQAALLTMKMCQINIVNE
jgi:nicotinamidase-related amidase